MFSHCFFFFYSGLRSLNANNASDSRHNWTGLWQSGDVKALSVRSCFCFPFGNIWCRGCGKNEMILRYILRWLPNLYLKTKQNTTVGSNKLFNLVLMFFCRYWLCINILAQNLNRVWGSDHVFHIAVDVSKHSHCIQTHRPMITGGEFIALFSIFTLFVTHHFVCKGL